LLHPRRPRSSPSFPPRRSSDLLAPFATVIDLYQASLGLPPSRGRASRAEVVHRLHGVLTRVGLPAERARDITSDLERALGGQARSEEHTSELQSLTHLLCRLLL